MKRIKGLWRNNAKLVALGLVIGLGLAYLLLYKLLYPIPYFHKVDSARQVSGGYRCCSIGNYS